MGMSVAVLIELASVGSATIDGSVGARVAVVQSSLCDCVPASCIPEEEAAEDWIRGARVRHDVANGEVVCLAAYEPYRHCVGAVIRHAAPRLNAD